MKYSKTKLLISLGIVSALTILSNATISTADSTLEQEFISVIQKHNQEEVIVENGISLRKGETLDLSQHPGWELSNKNTVKITKTGKVKPINEGTVYLSKKIDNKVHVIEVSVPPIQTQKYTTTQKSTTENRNYYKVFVDPGHGGSDNGASGFGYYEDQLNLQIAERLTTKLRAKGINVMMSRSDDTFVSLLDRSKMSNKYKPDVFVSIHQNSASTPAEGIETYYHTNKVGQKPLSDVLQENLIYETGAVNRKVKHNNFSVLRETDAVASLIENGFISHEQEANNLGNPEYQEKLATAIANGVEAYLKENVMFGDNSPVIDTGVVNTDGLNIRSDPDASAAQIGKLAIGTKVNVVEITSNNWYKIKYDGVYGYVSGPFVTLDSGNNNTGDGDGGNTVTPEPPKPNINLTDIDNHWAKVNILDFVSKGYVNGYADSTFRPNNNVTRAEFVSLINKVFGLTSYEDQEISDVKSNAWFYKDIMIGIKAGYIGGYQDGTFRPNDNITRQEAAKIVASVTDYKGDGVLQFKDNNQIGDWAKPHVDALNDNNIMGGYEDNTFRPKDNMTRAEAVATLYRVQK